MKFESQDKIDDYLMDRMPDDERMAFEKEVDGDKKIKEQLEFTMNLKQALKSRNEKLAAMERWKNDYIWKEDRRLATTSHPTGRRIIYWISGVAAVIVAGLFMIRNHNYGDDSSILLPSSGIDNNVFRAGSDNSDLKLLLSQKKYDEALALIEQKNQELKKDTLELIRNSTIDKDQIEYKLLFYRDQSDELKWLKAQALIGLNRFNDAFPLLNELRNSEGLYKFAADSINNNLLK